MKMVRILFIPLFRDSTFPKTPYLIKIENMQPFYMELSYDYIAPHDELRILRSEINRIFANELKRVTFQLIRGKVVGEN